MFNYTKEVVLWLWRSPTATSWASQGVQILRLLVLTPLLVSKLPLNEVASWYLFASTTFLGTILCQRSKMTFSRMVSMAIGGARDLSPIRANEVRGTTAGKEETRGLLKELYSTFSYAFLFVACISLIVSAVVGYFALRTLNADASDVSYVWLAFTAFLIGNFAVWKNSQYDSCLQGLGHVSLVNRVNVCVSLLSTVAGTFTLFLNGNIFVLACILQAVSFCGVITFRYLTCLHAETSELALGRLGISRRCLSWAKQPLLKGFVNQMCVSGVLQFSAVIIPFYYDTVTVATYLFTIRIFQMLVSFAMAPTFAYQPMFAKELAAGRYDELKLNVVAKARVSLLIFVLCSLGVGWGVPFFLKYLDTDLLFMSSEVWLMLVGFALVERFNMLCKMVCAVGNDIILVRQYAVIGVVSLLLLTFTGSYGMLGFVVVSLWGPPALIPTLFVLTRASELLRAPRSELLVQILAPAGGVLFVSSLFVLCVI